MVDEKKICLMTDLARFESGAGKEDLRVLRYSRSDYIGLGLLKNFFLTTIGYILLWGVIAAYYMEYLLENLHKMNIPVLIVVIVIGYLIFMIVYSEITYTRRYKRYEKARKNVRHYYTGLEQLSRTYYGEDTEGKRSAGGKRS